MKLKLRVKMELKLRMKRKGKCEDAHELHEKVLDVIFENGVLEEYDTPSIEEFTVLCLQINGDSFLRVKLEIPWGIFRHLVDQGFRLKIATVT
ncbi:unnamed protein product [Prunus armeniaca]|uniref:Uncharacterized protein n=1 Tax=Prunus armeniaca TaxID=36596 RepID=A0A6J5TKD8_PRUAR|nr:unnamed protein product [Prunus armeniaca]